MIVRQLPRLRRKSCHALEHCRYAFAKTPGRAGPTEEAAGVDDIGEGIRKAILQTGLRFLKGDITELKENVTNRDSKADIDKLLKMQKKYNSLLRSSELLRRERNVASYRVQQGKEKQIELEKEEISKLKYESGSLKHRIAELEMSMQEVLRDMIPELSLIPNYTHSDVPIGEYEDSKTVHVHGSKPEFNFPAKEHVEIGEKLGILDFRSASHATGHGFYYLRGAAAMLELALVQYAMQKAIAKGYTPVITPDIIKTDIVDGCGFHPRGDSTQVYSVSSHHGDQCLAGTAEIPLAGMFMNTLTNLKELPIKIVAFGRSFRAETGGHGHASRGLFRVHQFSKVELFGLTANEQGDESENMLNEIVDIQKEIIEELGLHYRLLDMSSKELGAPAYRKYDIEVWMPGRNDFGEVTSASNCTDYQSARLRIRYPNPSKNEFRAPGRKYTHTVNGTACAVPRIIVALLENYQQEDGSVELPKVLHNFLAPEYCHIKQFANRK